MDQVHNLEMSVGVLGFIFSIHEVSFSHAAALPGDFTASELIGLRLLFNIEHYDGKLKTMDTQGDCYRQSYD
jgi:hypothetical protein